MLFPGMAAETEETFGTISPLTANFQALSQEQCNAFRRPLRADNVGSGERRRSFRLCLRGISRKFNLDQARGGEEDIPSILRDGELQAFNIAKCVMKNAGEHFKSH